MVGKVTLVGAGPGDPGLMTLKGREALAGAQVVVYDRLVSPAILALIPEGAERIDVGKHAGCHPVPQEEISHILLERGRAGKNVVRLKGGDPFLFGRGGEELELLARHGVAFEVVPGVTSAIAAPAYGGIPVTHRDFCSSLHIITGHRRAGQPLDMDFDALCRTGGTLVFLMGVSALGEICAGLRAAGMDPSTPAAVVERGTTPRQRRISSDLAHLPERAAEEKLESPAVILVGGVCALAEELDWYDALPLKAVPIVVTRPKDRSGTLSSRLRALGADVREIPCIETVDCDDLGPLQAALGACSYDWAVFTSPAGVHAAGRALKKLGRDLRALYGMKLAAIGPGTAAALDGYGLTADLVPEVYDGAHLARALLEALPPGGAALLLRARQGGRELPETLKAAGMIVADVPLYDTVYRCDGGEELRELLEREKRVWVTFTSASTVRGFAAAAGEGADLSRVVGLCIGAQTAAEAGRYGIPVQVAREAAIDSLVELACTAAGKG